MTTTTKTLCALAALVPAAWAASPLKLASNDAGNNFFNTWRFNASLTDPTNFGNIHYVNQSVATASQLGFVNSAGNVILKVDNTSSDPAPGPFSQFGRNTVMVVSNDPIHIGTLVAMDAVHMPYGCSVWPSFWTLDVQNGTDAGGEIDIVETVNLQTFNEYSLHTPPGCTLTNDTSFPHSGQVVSTNCDAVDFNVTGNQGCIIDEPASSNSVGEAFATGGGGVYAMYWSTAGVQMWFFSRQNIPSDLTSNSPDPSSWPTPTAAYPASGCDPSTFFNPNLNLIIDIDVCGAFAGNDAVFASTCQGTCQSVVGTASNYDTAYWEIQYIKTFTAAGNSSASSSASGAGASSTSASGSGSGSSGSGAGRVAGGMGAVVVGLVMGVVGLAVL